MLEMIESFFDRVMTIGLAMCAMIALVAVPASNFFKSYELLRQDAISQKVTIERLELDVKNIRSLINENSSVSTFDVSSAINNLENSLSSIEQRNTEILSILRDEPDTLATIREVNVKYDHIIKILDKVESDIERTEDKVFAGSQAQLSIWVAIAIFLIGAIPSFLLGQRRKTKESR